MTNLVPVRRALISLSDKSGLDELAAGLARHGVEIVSTGGTAAKLREAGVRVRDISDLTGEQHHEPVRETEHYQLQRLLATQRMAKLGSWAYYPETGEFYLSEVTKEFFAAAGRSVARALRRIRSHNPKPSAPRSPSWMKSRRSAPSQFR